MMKKIRAELARDKLIIWDPKKGTKIYRLGFFGKPIGVAKPREKEAFDVPLVLDPLEGLYLAERGKIEIIDMAKKPMRLGITKTWARRTCADFDIKYAAYKDLRDKGYVVLPGVKYGCDFLVYERGPGMEHSPYMVQVKRSKEPLTATDIVRAGRLATTVRKSFIIAMIGAKKRVRYLAFRWWRP